MPDLETRVKELEAVNALKTIDDKMKLLEDTASKMKDYLEENENFNKGTTKWNRIVGEMRDNVECV